LEAFSETSGHQFASSQTNNKVGGRVARWLFFKPKNTNSVKFWSELNWKVLTYFTTNLNILLIFGICYEHLVHFVFIWYFFPGFGIMYQEKSGNPGLGGAAS
jgi:hypothetical protein